MSNIKHGKSGWQRIVSILCVCVIAVPLICNAMVSDQKYNEQKFVLPDTAFMEVGTSRHTQYEKDALSGETVTCPLTLDGFEKKIETSGLEVWFREEADSFRIVDKRSGYIWGSLAEDKPEGLNQMWSAFANGLCSFEYFDANGTAQRASAGTFGVTSKYKWDDNSVTCTMNVKKEKLSLSFTMTVGENTVHFAVDDSTITEKGEAKLKSVYFMPFLGSVREDAIDGYVFVPDGPGALIRFRKSMSYTAGFNQKVYGLDMGIDTLEEANDLNASRTNDYLVDAPQVTVPVYGIVHGAYQNAVFAVLEQGEEFASIQAMPAGVITAWTWAAARFDYRQLYIHPTSKDGVGIQRPQDERNDVNAAMTFYFLTGEEADYSGMAVKYRELLQEKGILSQERLDATLPLRLHVLGADVKKQFLIQGKQVFTTWEETQNILQRLKENGITNISLSFEGWQTGGVNGASYGTMSFDSSVGTQAQAQAVRDLLVGQNGRFYLTLNPVTANEEQIWLAGEAAKTLSRTYAKFIRPNSQVMYNVNYVIKPGLAAETVLKTHDGLSDFSLSLDQWGYRLYSEHTRESEISRTEALALIVQAQETISQRGTAVSNPNQYLWENTAEYFDIPIVSGQYLYETDTVPFLQIVLKGCIDYYTPFINQGFCSTNSILKMAEYGTYPSFIVADCDNVALMDTPQQDLFTVKYDDWKNEIQTIYDRLANVLLAVEGQQILQHRMIAEGVVRITYSNNMKLYVNYNSSEYVGETTVPAQDFVLITQ